MLNVLTGCVGTQTETAIDRLRDPAADHARALAGNDVPLMRETGLVILSMLEAYADW